LTNIPLSVQYYVRKKHRLAYIKGGSKIYPYHNQIRKRISNGELIGYRFVDQYKQIGECLLLEFRTPPFIRPIRPRAYEKYADVIGNDNCSIKKGNDI